MKLWCRILAVLPLAACSATPQANLPVSAAPPPKDDGQAAEGGAGGSEHAAALEQLKVARMELRADKQRSFQLSLPDAPHWTRVRFHGVSDVESLVGFRYGKSHHAIVGAFVTHVEDNAVPGACTKSFEDRADRLVKMFDVDIERDPTTTLAWQSGPADIVTVTARTATLLMRETYAAAYATYPAWKGACLIVGVAVPGRGEDARAREVRDRFAKEVLPHVAAISKDEPKERY